MRATLIGLFLIFFGVAVALGNEGIFLRPWLAPIFLVGLGLLAMAFPREREQRHEGRREHEAHEPHEEHDR